MGIILGLALFAGGLIGLLLTGLSGALGVVVAVRSARKRRHVWRSMAAVGIGAGALLTLAIRIWPTTTVRPGSDYDIVMRTFFVRALAHAAVPGVAALLGALASLLCPAESESRNAGSANWE